MIRLYHNNIEAYQISPSVSCINIVGLVPLATVNPKDSILPSFLVSLQASHS